MERVIDDEGIRFTIQSIIYKFPDMKYCGYEWLTGSDLVRTLYKFRTGTAAFIVGMQDNSGIPKEDILEFFDDYSLVNLRDKIPYHKDYELVAIGDIPVKNREGFFHTMFFILDNMTVYQA